LSRPSGESGVIVAQRTGKDDDGNRVTLNKYASTHDLRRSFGTRWSRRVMPAVLKDVMRHSDISTTMKYYVRGNAQVTAAELWRIAPCTSKASADSTTLPPVG
jgi:integrase